MRWWSARGAHARHYCALLEAATADLKGKDVHAGLAAVQGELPNALAAWRHALSRADHEGLDRARDAMDHYFYYRSDFATASGLFGDAARALDAALAADTWYGAERAAASRVVGRLLVHQSEHERNRSRLVRSLELANAALERLEGVGTAADVAYAKLNLGTGLMRASSYEESERLMREVLAFALKAGDLYLQGAAHNALANLMTFTGGNLAQAEEHHRASLHANRELGNLEGINGALINLGACRYDVGDLEGARLLWQEAADLAVRLGYTQREAVLHNNLGSLLEAQGRLQEAEERYRLSLDLRRRIDDRSGQANVLHNLARLAAERGDPLVAQRKLEEALRLFVQAAEPAGEAHVRSSLARLLAGLGQAEDARGQAEAALSLALESRSHGDILGTLLTVAVIHERAGEPARAAELASRVADAATGRVEQVRVEAHRLMERVTASSRPESSRPPGATGKPRRGAGAHPEDVLRLAKRELSHLRR